MDNQLVRKNQQEVNFMQRKTKIEKDAKETLQMIKASRQPEILKDTRHSAISKPISKMVEIDIKPHGMRPPFTAISDFCTTRNQ